MRKDALRRVRRFDAKQWPVLSALLIQDAIDATLRARKRCSVMLTGGRSAERLYKAWAKLPAFQRLENVGFFFGDERCVPPDHPASNYGMVRRTLFAGGVPTGCSIFRMEGEDQNCEAAACRYEQILPDRMDVLLLGVGEDGHIASLFPRSASLRESIRRVVDVNGPKPPQRRLTIVPSVIAQARSIFVLAIGVAKAEVFAKTMLEPGDFDNLPARLVLNATWLLDAELPEETFHE